MEFEGIDLSSFNIKFNLSEFLANESQTENSSLAAVTDDDVAYQKQILNFYIMGVAGTSVCALGIVCNILSMIVLTRKVMNSSTYSYLAGLAICDLLNLIMTLFLLTYDTKPVEKNIKARWDDYYVYLFPYVHPLAVSFQVTSIWLTLAFTVDRYIMICHPFSAENLCNVSRARKVIFGIYVFGFIFNIPRFLEYRTYEIEIPDMDGRQNRMMLDYTELGRNPVFVKVVHSWLYPICVCGIPFLTLAVLNSFLIRAVHLSRKKGKQINAKEKKRNDTTIMLIGVIVLFLICQGPAVLSRVVYAINNNYAIHSMKFHIVNEVGNLLVMLNSAINIVPYYLFGKKFRQEFWRLFCRCFLSKEELRRLTRSLSFSIDNRRRVSMGSNNSAQDLNDYKRESEPYANYNGFHKDSFGVPLINPLPVHKGSDQTQSSADSAEVNQVEVGRGSREASPIPLRVKWEMDNNKNEKYNVSIEVQPPSSSSGDL